MKKKIYIPLLFFALFFFQQGCRREKVPQPYRPTDAHDAYLFSLRQAGLADTALGQDWIAAAKEALFNPLDVNVPHQEIFYAEAAEALAVAYRFGVKRGQRIEIDVAFTGQKPCRLFIDAYRVRGETQADWQRVASAGESEKRLEYEPRADAEYVIRLQPELLRGGQFQVTLRKVAALEFPVEGKDSHAFGGGFGAPREGGRRTHHGVDIFARRHTPVLATSDATVIRVRESDIGGLHIWLYDPKRQINIYFAHLQTQDVQENMQVKTGQQIGTVGNTGNARTTPPHLHFGIYARGPVDPAPFITKVPDKPRPVTADPNLIGRWIRTKEQNTPLRLSADTRAPIVASLNRHLPMKALAATKQMYRVALPDGRNGYIQETNIEPAESQLWSLISITSQPIIEAPDPKSASKQSIDSGDSLAVMGVYEGYWYIKTENGQTGWMSIPAADTEDRSSPVSIQ